MLFNPAYDFPHVAERIVMPEEQKPTNPVTPATSGAARQATSRVADRPAEQTIAAFLNWAPDYMAQARRDAFEKVMRNASITL